MADAVPSGISDPALIKLVNRLQDVFSLAGSQGTIDLPQIVVVGSQSSGKSSVLENIVGRDFLPRGTGIVTRRPLVLQLVQHAASGDKANGDSDAALEESTDKDANPDEWGEFLHVPGKKFFDFNQIRDEIARETEAKVGRNAGISDAPINLRIYSPHVLTLTLVDLPGLTRVPVGDQPRDIERQIRDMVLNYIQRPNSLILAVTAANVDLANSDGLKLAREVDPEALRTMGVLTKVDIMDNGTDVIDILAGRIIPLRMGYVPIVNRGQRDIDNKKTIRDALEAERRFFENHHAYRSKSSYCGTPYLTKKLHVVLLNHIKKTLPDIKARISSSLQKYAAELNVLGASPSGDSSGAVLDIVTKFSREWEAVLDGMSLDLPSNELSGGARISFIFHSTYADGVKAIDPFDTISDVDIRTTHYNLSGTSPSPFQDTRAFTMIVKQQILRLENPGLKCVELIHSELIRIMQLLLRQTTFSRYPTLREKIRTVATAFLLKAKEPTDKLIRDLVGMESSYINMLHPDFARAARNIRQGPEPKEPPTPVDPKTGKPLTPRPTSPPAADGSETISFFGSFFSSKNRKKMAAMEPPPSTLKATGAFSEREMFDVEVTKKLIRLYFNITRDSMINYVPKAITYNLVGYSKANMHRELMENVYRSTETENLLQESEATVARRKECQKMVEALNKALAIIDDV